MTPRRMEAEAMGRGIQSVYPDAALLLCRDGRDCRALLDTCPVLLGLVALDLPDVDGIDLAAALLEESRLDRILVAFNHLTEVTYEFLADQTVGGFIDLTESADGHLVEAICRVGGGAPYASYALRKARTIAYGNRAPLDRLLSGAERMVLSVIGDGSDDLAASDSLGLSIHTVHTHRRNIMRKLGLKTRAELIRESTIRGVVRFGPVGVIRPGFERLRRKLARKVPTIGQS